MTMDPIIPAPDPLQHDEALLDLPPLTQRDPFVLFSEWFEVAKKSEPSDANAFCLSTMGLDDVPNARMVLLKQIHHDGFVFFTHYTSQKGQELSRNPNISMCFHWKSLMRQIKITGIVTKIPFDQSQAYFHSRPRDSQIGAWISKQSEDVSSRNEMMDYRQKIIESFKDTKVIPCPENWGGYFITPKNFEFWRNGAYRLHDRYVFNRTDKDKDWKISLLYP